MELQTTTLVSPGNLAYSHFHLYVGVDSHEEIVLIDNIRPSHTQKYNKEVSSPPVGQAASTKATVSRIIQVAMNSKAEWDFHITDPLGNGITLSPDQLPSAGFDFVGETNIPAPPSTHMDIEILSFWSVRGNPLQNFDGYDKPAYSNICQIINLKVPSNLYGSQVFHTTLKLWPK